MFSAVRIKENFSFYDLDLNSRFQRKALFVSLDM